MQNGQNQAVTMSPLFFDPICKRAYGEERNGKLDMRYREDSCGIKVEEDGRVSFCMYAPQAQTVEVAGVGGSMGRDRISLQKEEDGYFRKTVSGIAPGFHYHEWFVDGVCVVNPVAPVCYGCFGAKNFFELPKPGEDFWFLKDVLHGDVQLHKYASSVNGHMKSCYVYTPPSYEERGDRRYPVLYVQHGVGENETGWIWNGKLNLILDNLIAEKKCEEMIVVMCCGYAFCPGEDPVFYPGDFDRELTQDCIPYVEEHFAVKKGRKCRAAAGLSLGSAQAALAVSRHQEMFAYLGVFSGVRLAEMEKILAQHVSQPMSYIFLGCGSGEKELGEKQAAFAQSYLESGIPVMCRTYEGYHEWHVWRECFRDYVQQIFHDTKEEDTQEPRPVKAAERILLDGQLDKQTMESHVLFFDPIYKGLIFEVDEKGQPNGRYRDVHPGVEITKQGSARFWVKAQGAQSVEVDIWGMGRFALKPAEEADGDRGLWSCEVSQIEPGFHYHTYWINGTQAVNPDAPVGYGGFYAVNYLEMPEENFEHYRFRQTAHGTVHQHYYRSGQTGRMKLCYVYTPPGYENSREKRYPVLYLQHGGGENETGWLWQGKIANLADNLLAQGQMKEMIIVMNAGYAFLESGEQHPSLTAFLQELPESCVPFIDGLYRTAADRDHRALAGLSMGGMQTQKIVFAHPELFAWAGIFSGGLVIQNEEDDYRETLFDPQAFEKRFRLLFVACGVQEKFYESTKRNAEEVLAHHVPLEFFEDHGYHDWTFWRHCADAFLRKLF